MLKFESEFKINNKWEIGELVDIDKNNRNFYIKVQKDKDETKIIKYENNLLICHNTNRPISELSNEAQDFKINEQVEFFNGNAWQKGTIKSKKGKLYVIDYLSNESFPQSKIFYLTSIRKNTESDQTLILNLDNCKVFSLDMFQKMSNSNKNIKKMINKIKKLFSTNEIEFIFYSNFNLFLFGCTIEEELINKMIDISYEHFSQIENDSNKKSQNDCGSSSSSNNEKQKKQDKNNYKFKEEIIIEKIIYDMQKGKIKNTSAKVETKTTKNINEISLTIKAKDENSLREVINILDMVQIYFTVSVSEKDNFFDPNSKDKNISYYEKLYGIVNCNHYKYDDKSTTIRVVGKKDNVNFFKQTIEQYFSSQELKKKKLDELIDIKKQILNLS